VRGSEGEFAVAAGLGPEGVDVVRRRFLGGGMQEEISISNESGVAVDVRVELECAADFKDILELRGFGRAAERGEVMEEVGEGSLRFAYRRDGFLRGTLVRVDGVEAVARRGSLSFEVRLEAEETRDVRVLVELEEGVRRSVFRRARRCMGWRRGSRRDGRRCGEAGSGAWRTSGRSPSTQGRA